MVYFRFITSKSVPGCILQNVERLEGGKYLCKSRMQKFLEEMLVYLHFKQLIYFFIVNIEASYWYSLKMFTLVFKVLNMSMP